VKRLLATPVVDRLWLRQNRRLQTAALLCACLLAADLLLFLAAVRPLAADLRDLDARNAELRKSHAAAVLFQEQKKKVGAVTANVPTQKDMPLLVKELVQTARGLGLRVSSVKYDIPKHGGEGIAAFSFSLPVTGRYPDLKRFVYELETSRHLIGIEELELKADHESVALALKLITYVRGQ
jgi:Tfp pilus assembly protein PilO